MANHKGKVAVCGLGALGLITQGRKQKVTYPDGKTGTAYIGIHLTDKVAPIGSHWCSRNPDILGDLTKLIDKAERYESLEN